MEPDGQTVMRFADRALLAELVALLPPYVVTVRTGEKGIACPFVRYLAEGLIEQALVAGYELDRTNADGPLADWDGWLVISSPVPVFLQIAKPGGGPLES